MIIDNKSSFPNIPKMAIADAANFLGISVQGVHKQLKLKGITCPKLGKKSYINFETAKKLFDFKFKHQVIVGQIVKGGTGKTTTIEHIASCANSYGARVLKIDADPQGNLTDANGVDAEKYPALIDLIKGEVPIEQCIVNICPGMDLIPSRIENVVLDNVLVNLRFPLNTVFADFLAPIANSYDFIFIDCPPTMGQAVTAASLYANTIIAPLNPDKFSAKGLAILRQEIEDLNKKFKTQISYKVFLNKFSNKTLLSDKAVFSLISNPELEGKVLSTTIQASQEIPNITDENRNVFSHLRKSVVREDFDRLTREILEINPN